MLLHHVILLFLSISFTTTITHSYDINNNNNNNINNNNNNRSPRRQVKFSDLSEISGSGGVAYGVIHALQGWADSIEAQLASARSEVDHLKAINKDLEHQVNRLSNNNYNNDNNIDRDVNELKQIIVSISGEMETLRKESSDHGQSIKRMDQSLTQHKSLLEAELGDMYHWVSEKVVQQQGGIKKELATVLKRLRVVESNCKTVENRWEEMDTKASVLNGLGSRLEDLEKRVVMEDSVRESLNTFIQQTGKEIYNLQIIQENLSGKVAVIDQKAANTSELEKRVMWLEQECLLLMSNISSLQLKMDTKPKDNSKIQNLEQHLVELSQHVFKQDATLSALNDSIGVANGQVSLLKPNLEGVRLSLNSFIQDTGNELDKLESNQEDFSLRLASVELKQLTNTSDMNQRITWLEEDYQVLARNLTGLQLKINRDEDQQPKMLQTLENHMIDLSKQVLKQNTILAMLNDSVSASEGKVSETVSKFIRKIGMELDNIQASQDDFINRLSSIDIQQLAMTNASMQMEKRVALTEQDCNALKSNLSGLQLQLDKDDPKMVQTMHTLKNHLVDLSQHVLKQDDMMVILNDSLNANDGKVQLLKPNLESISETLTTFIHNIEKEMSGYQANQEELTHRVASIDMQQLVITNASVQLENRVHWVEQDYLHINGSINSLHQVMLENGKDQKVAKGMQILESHLIDLSQRNLQQDALISQLNDSLALLDKASGETFKGLTSEVSDLGEETKILAADLMVTWNNTRILQTILSNITDNLLAEQRDKMVQLVNGHERMQSNLSDLLIFATTNKAEVLEMKVGMESLGQRIDVIDDSTFKNITMVNDAMMSLVAKDSFVSMEEAVKEEMMSLRQELGALNNEHGEVVQFVSTVQKYINTMAANLTDLDKANKDLEGRLTNATLAVNEFSKGAENAFGTFTSDLENVNRSLFILHARSSVEVEELKNRLIHIETNTSTVIKQRLEWLEDERDGLKLVLEEESKLLREDLLVLWNRTSDLTLEFKCLKENVTKDAEERFVGVVQPALIKLNGQTELLQANFSNLLVFAAATKAEVLETKVAVNALDDKLERIVDFVDSGGKKGIQVALNLRELTSNSRERGLV